ncbi:hypothetical protein VTK73DRAFT_3675 [Phialemonium thermophilum]|uniref:NB-ARC domain-containing protein n=1 Tax=Phialemonium thermophilum TaxID=223376 RepID=A0ABR3WYA9_9PEZI
MEFLLCCLPSSERNARKPPKYTEYSSDDDVSPGKTKGKKEKIINLLDDEGESYQKDQWQMVIEEKRQALQAVRPRLLRKFGEDPASSLLIDHVPEISPQKFLQSLTTTYTENGHATRMTRVREIFSSMKPFVAAVNTLVQNDTIASLVWGSLTLVFESVLRYASFWDDLRTMFEDVAQALPRFQGYVQVLQTPRLHEALRSVYATFIDLCIMTLDCLSTPRCYMALRVQWSSFASQFEDRRKLLGKLNADFEKEAQFAHIQKADQRHKQVMGVLEKNGESTEQVHPAKSTQLRSNVPVPRNEQFTGRDDTLALMHSTLEPGFDGDVKSRSFRSCLLHAVGGMGKTETAIEYTYRFGQHYSYIIWLRAQTKVLLQESFNDAVTKFGIVPDSKMPSGRIKDAAMDWFRTTEEPWLLIYDNVEEISILQEYWPVAPRGAAIVTTQNPTFSHWTSQAIQLDPLSASEGSKLIQKYLRRGDSEKGPAEQLSTTLGGMPLAITHFAGYISRSQCPIEHITVNLNQRLRASRIWKMDQQISSSRKYQYTLNTVWELAFHRLTPDARLLLEFLAFLDPDNVPVDLFIGTKGEQRGADLPAAEKTSEWQYWDVDRFNDAISILLERNLVHRTVLDDIDSLRTHRALQLCVLQQLDEDLPKRAARFSEVVAIVRKALPRANVVKRGDDGHLSQFAKYIPQVSSLQKVFQSSEPAIEGTLDFALVLNDASYYSYTQDNGYAALTFAETGEAICSSMPNDDKAKDILPDFLAVMSAILYSQGLSGRQRALEGSRRVVELRKKALAGIPPDEWTELQTVNFTRAHADLGWVLCEGNSVREAAPLFQLCVENYKRIKNESRLALVLANQLTVLSTSQKASETREQGRLALSKIESLVDQNSPLAILIKYQVCLAYFTIGDVQEALDLVEQVFQSRSMDLGRSDHLTLGSQYCLAVFLQNLGNLEDSESNLREILENGHRSDSWVEDDIVRVKFRLSIVLRAQERLEEADKVLDDIKNHVGRLRPSGSTDFTDADDMALLDWRVTLDHGRTAGMWSNGKYW